MRNISMVVVHEAPGDNNRSLIAGVVLYVIMESRIIVDAIIHLWTVA